MTTEREDFLRCFEDGDVPSLDYLLDIFGIKVTAECLPVGKSIMLSENYNAGNDLFFSLVELRCERQGLKITLESVDDARRKITCVHLTLVEDCKNYPDETAKKIKRLPDMWGE